MHPIDNLADVPLPIFPLPNVSLFPGQLLPLHIFEPRFRALFRDARDGRGLVVMARLQPGYEPHYNDSPAIFPIAGLGAITGAKDLPDGRSMVVLTGRSRVRLCRELEDDHLYRTGLFEALDDKQGESEMDLAPHLNDLVQLVESLIETTSGERDELHAALKQCADQFLKLDFLCAAFAPGPSHRQALLEILSPVERCQELTQILLRLSGGQHLN